jgi:hypothetical protein
MYHAAEPVRPRDAGHNRATWRIFCAYVRGSAKTSETELRVMRRARRAGIRARVPGVDDGAQQANATIATTMPTMRERRAQLVPERVAQDQERNEHGVGQSTSTPFSRWTEAMRLLGRLRVVRHHDDRLAELAVEPLEQAEDLPGRWCDRDRRSAHRRRSARDR